MSDLLTASMAWMDEWWDDERALLWNPPGAYTEAFREPRQGHMVRESAWYGLGLLRREADGDRARAEATLGAVADAQYDEPGQVWHGTFRRFPRERHPPPGARIWIDYDPNWRQFIGCTLALTLDVYDVPSALFSRLERSIELAVDGEPDGRVGAWYSNIALMKSWLDVWAGHAFHRRELTDRGERLAREVVALFDRHSSFDEYNSPTYYGIDLFALALWRSHSQSSLLREEGERIEAALWDDISRWYHGGLRNLCGPYTRAYGMDMSAYVANLSLWLWDGLGRDAAPMPSLLHDFDHSHDLCFAPAIAEVGARIPEGLHQRFLKPPAADRQVAQTLNIDPHRAATGWLGPDTMIGAEHNPVGLGGWRQFHPATMHWAAPDGVHWLRVFPPGPIDAVAQPGVLTARCRCAAGAEVVVEVGPSTAAFDVLASRWQLPGRALDVRINGEVDIRTSDVDGVVTVTYVSLVDGEVTLRFSFV